MSTRRISDEQIRLTDIPNNATLAASGDAIVGIRNNLSASESPDGDDNFAAGYSVGSLWQWGQRVWRCYGDGQWDELLRNPSGAADGKLLGHVSGAPAWVSPVGGYLVRNAAALISASNIIALPSYSSVTGGMSVVSTYGLEVPTTGVYVVAHNTHWAYYAGPAARFYVNVRINSTNQNAAMTTSYITTGEPKIRPDLSAVGIFSLTAGDVVSLYATLGSLDMYFEYGTLSVFLLR